MHLQTITGCIQVRDDAIQFIFRNDQGPQGQRIILVSVRVGLQHGGCMCGGRNTVGIDLDVVGLQVRERILLADAVNFSKSKHVCCPCQRYGWRWRYGH